MLPILLSRSEIHDDLWDKAVADSQQRVMYACSWYLDIVCDDWKAIVWPSSENYQVVMPIPVRRKWGIHVVQQPLFCQYLGIFYQEPVSHKLASDFLTLLDVEFIYISQYSFNPNNSLIFKELLGNFGRFRCESFVTHHLSLAQTYEGIRCNYTIDRKSNLRKGRAQQWSVKRNNDISNLLLLFKKYNASQIEGGVDQQAYSVFERLFAELRERCETELWYAEANGKMSAGVLLVRFFGVAIYLFNAADVKGRAGNARTVLLDQYIERNAGQDLIVDFESPSKKSVKSFYKSFGATEVFMISINKNGLPFPLRQIQNWRRSFLK